MQPVTGLDCAIRPLTEAELNFIGGGDKVDFSGNNVCKNTPPDKPENSAFGYAMLALAIVLL
jgi:hypothetical protein